MTDSPEASKGKSKGPTVVMVEKLPPGTDIRVAQAITDRGGQVVCEDGEPTAYLPIPRQDGLFRKVKLSTDSDE